MKKKMKKAKPTLYLLNIKISDKELRVLKNKAKLYAGGNLSAWLRYCGANHRPAKTVVIR